MEYIKTIRELFQNPGNVIDSFVFEREVKFQHPLSFGVFGIAIVILINTLLIDFDPSLYVGEIGSESDQMTQLSFWIAFSKLKATTQFISFTIFILLIPSLTLPGLFFFRDDIEGFYSNFILNSYAVGASMLILILLIPVWLVDHSLLSTQAIRSYLPILLVGVPIIRIYQNYFLIDNKQGWVRIISSFITGCIVYFLLKSFSTAIVGYFIFAVNRFLDIWMTV